MYYYNVLTTVGFMFRVRVQYLVGYGVRMDAFFLHGSSLPRLFSHRLSGPVWQRGGFRSEIPTACPSSQAGRTNGSQRTENGRREYLPGGKSWRIAKSLFLIPFRAIQWFHMPYGRSVLIKAGYLDSSVTHVAAGGRISPVRSFVAALDQK